ncbi:hypothetical protein EJ05DRAFT_344506 [Pseudovirgaria hyperparasitica]|uniref:Protein kinase domain-containing protein n=1 Tax=Pseudovirgaria hyperparasitica TaxID=470096 RepID=A0A6A6W933_9PEZI|nr:uncharacterized protein EJ05DRAFT_344506 [Pseudovirgaria hyperparasitica]KAF2759388.1 hypothetical protein EJ05DRAFT_344506 [Pseudovirgaria hyperparasitica]
MHSPSLPPCVNAVDSIRYGLEDDCQFTITSNGVHFEVLLSVDSPPHTIERDYLDRIHALQKAKNQDELDLLFDEISDVLAVSCQPFFRQFAQCHGAFSPRTLNDYCNPKVVGLRVCTRDEKLCIILEEDLSTFPYYWNHAGLSRYQLGPGIPAFALSQIEVLDVMKHDAVFKVCIEGTTLCAKMTSHQSELHSLKREISSLLQIQRTDFRTRLSIPSVVGLITSDEDCCSALGFLMDYIDTDTTKPHLQALVESASKQQRQKWATQISDMVQQLHLHGLVWGDVKAQNVLISCDDNAWVVDFGGSFTDGWVTGELANTKEGDMMGLQKIQSLLRND